MNLVTNIAIDYSTGVGKNGNGIVTGVLGTKAFMSDMSLTVNYTYTSADGDLVDGNGSFTLPASDVQAMYNAVSAGLPDPNVDFNGYIETAFYKAFINQMVSTFEGLTSASQVDLIA